MNRQKQRALKIVKEVLEDNPAASPEQLVRSLSSEGIVRTLRTVRRYKSEVYALGPFPQVSMEALASETLAYLRASMEKAFQKQQYQQVSQLSRAISWLCRLDTTFGAASEGATREPGQWDLLTQLLNDWASGQLEQGERDD